MADEVLGIQITADAAGAVRGIQQATGAINKLPVAANKATAAIAKMPKASNEATFALTNLSRVAQDAPYGFIGIQNNLNPLLESFQRLRKEAGSNAGALKALGRSLMGAGGIGLAVGAVSSLLLVFGDRIFKSGKKAKEAADDVWDYAEAVKSATKSVANEAARVSSLVAFLNKENVSRKEKVAVIKELQSISPQYFAMLDKEKASIGQVTAAYNQYLTSLKRTVEAKVLESQLGDVIKNRLDLEKELGIGSSNFETIRYGEKMIRVQKSIYIEESLRADKQRELNGLKTQEEALARRLADLRPAGINIQPDSAGSKDPVENLLKNRLKLLDEYRTKFKSINEFTNFGFLPIIDFSKLPKDFGNATKAIRDELSDMFKSMETAFILNGKKAGVLTVDALIESYREEMDRKRNKIVEALEKGGLKDARVKIEAEIVPPRRSSFEDLLIKLPAIEFDKNGKSVLKDISNDALLAAETINSVLTPAFDNMFDAILAGEPPLQAFFNGILDSIAEIIKALVKAAIQAAILSIISNIIAPGAGSSFGQMFGKLTGMGGVARPQSISGGSRAALSVTVNGRLSGNSLNLVGSRTTRLNNLLG